MPAPLATETRNAIADDIRAGLGRNAIARKRHVATGTVTNIARDNGLWFENDWMTTTGTAAHRIDAAAARLEREAQLYNELFSLPQTTRQRDNRDTKAYRHISYALYDVRRHHDRNS